MRGQESKPPRDFEHPKHCSTPSEDEPLFALFALCLQLTAHTQKSDWICASQCASSSSWRSRIFFVWCVALYRPLWRCQNSPLCFSASSHVKPFFHGLSFSFPCLLPNGLTLLPIMLADPFNCLGPIHSSPLFSLSFCCLIGQTQIKTNTLLSIQNGTTRIWQEWLIIWALKTPWACIFFFLSYLFFFMKQLCGYIKTNILKIKSSIYVLCWNLLQITNKLLQFCTMTPKMYQKIYKSYIKMGSHQ